MAEYSFNDINEAKKRVKEMQSKSRGAVHSEPEEGILSLFSSLEDTRDIAFCFALLYLTEKERVSPALLALISGILL